MKIKFQISKLTNIFFFVSNLTEWHFSCRDNYNKIWIKNTGKLTNKEKNWLQKFSKLMNKYGFKYEDGKFMYLGQFFLSPVKNEDEIWNQVEEFIDEEELKLIKETFSIFKDRFKKIWDKNKIENWQKKLEREVKNKQFINPLNKISSLLSYNDEGREINVSLIGAPDKNWSPAGGANLNSKNITLEIPLPKINRWNIEYALGIILHEISHIFLNNSEFKKIIKETVSSKEIPKLELVKPSRPKSEIIKEIILHLIAPYSYLTDQYFSELKAKKFIKKNEDEGKKELNKIHEGKEGNLNLINYYIISDMRKSISSYFTQDKSFDEKIVKRIINYFK